MRTVTRVGGLRYALPVVILLLFLVTGRANATTSDELSLLPTVDPLNRSEGTLSNGGKWTTLNWAAGAGQDTTTGWGPVAAFPSVNGAYWNPGNIDGRYGDAATVTMQTAPGLSERYVSIWLDMPSPGNAKSGYQLRWTVNPETTKYAVKLSKWVSGTETVLASSPEVSIPNGTTMAIVDTGSAVSAWRSENGGTSYTSMLSAADSTYNGGYAGLDAAGNFSRSLNFEAGSLLGLSASSTPVLDNLERSEVPLATGKWTKTQWATEIGGAWLGGYRGYGSNGGLAGAYWNQGTVGDIGGGALVAATVGTGATPSGQYLGLWLDMPSPGSARSGYEARFTGTNGTATAYKVELSKWVSGTRTVLATKEGFSLAVGTTMALTDSGSGVVLWTGTGTTLTPLLTVSDTTYSSGYAGLEVNGGAGTMYNFRAGSLGTGPDTTITSGPTGNVVPQNVSFAFTSSPGGATFTCALDAAAYATCTSPKAYPTISEGAHTFRVRATDGLGNTDPTPAERSFTVVMPPAVTTKEASAVKTNQATLNATVDPRGSATTYQFEWGTTASYGKVVPATAKSAGSGTTAVEVSEPITGLNPDTAYHFRISATNANGTSKGEDKTFTTTNAPVVTTDDPTEVSAHEAKLNASINPHGASTSYYFEYGPTTAYGTKVPVTPKDAGSGRAAVQVAETVNGLTEGATYHYRVIASNEVGTRNGADKAIETPLLPDAVTQSSESLDENEAIVTGSVDPNGEASIYRFEYGQTAQYGQVASVGEEAGEGEEIAEASEALANLQPETTYHYRIVATSSAGTDVGVDRTFTTGARTVSALREQEEREEEWAYTAKFTQSPESDFIGMMWSGIAGQTEREPNVLNHSGAKMFRMFLAPDVSSTYVEKMFRQLSNRGIQVLPYIELGWPADSGSQTIWINYVKAQVAKYGPNGSFWKPGGGYGGSTPMPALWWEIGNEPNLGKNTPSISVDYRANDYAKVKEYGNIFQQMSDAAKSVDSVRIILAGLFTTGSTGCSPECHIEAGEFIRQMDHDSSYNAVSIHPYAYKVKDGDSPNNAQGEVDKEVGELVDRIKSNITKVRSALTGENAGKKIWITELGFPVASNNQKTFPSVTEAVQAKLITRSFSMIKANREDLGIAHLFYYNIRDQNRPEWDWNCGLRTAGGKIKRESWAAFASQTPSGDPNWRPKPKNVAGSSSVKPKAATVSATMNPYGLSTSYWVKYGQGPTSNTYGSFTSPQDAGWEESDVVNQAVIPNLSPKTTYHYRIVAENEDEEKTETSDIQFTTPPSSSTSNNVERVLHGINGYLWVEGWVKEGEITGPNSGPGLAGVHVHVKIFRNEVFQQLRDVVTDSQGHYDSGYIQVGKGTLETRSDFPGGGEWDPSSSGVKTFTVKDGYLIKAKHSGKCMDVENGWFADGVRVMHGDCNGNANQVFSLQPKGTGEYLEIIARHSGKCLDVANASTADGAGIIQHGCHGGSNQAFREAWWGETPYVSYVPQHSGKCLDVTGASQGWVPIQQWTCNSAEQQRFSLNPVESGPIPTETFIEVDQVLHGSPGLVSVHGSLFAGPYSMANRVVHVEFDNAQVGGWSTVADLPVTVNGSGGYEYRDYGIQPGYYNIRARFVGNGEFGESKSGEHNRTIKRGYQIIAKHSGRCVSLSENRNVNGQRFLQWDCAPPSANGQVFSFWEPEGSGWYQLRVNGTNRCLDVVNVSGENGAGLQLWDCLGGGQTNQHWKREPIQGDSGYYGLMPRHTFRPDIPSYKCMDVSGAGTGNGVLVNQWECHWGNNQRFELRGVIDP